MSLREEYRAAVLGVGNKVATFETYWPHVELFIDHVRDRRGRLTTRDDVTIEDVYEFRKFMAGRLSWAPKSCNQAIAAVKLLFSEVLGRRLEEPEDRPLRLRQSQHERRRYVSRQHVLAVFDQLTFRNRLIAQLQYAGMLRLADVLRIRVRDINFDHEQIEISDTKHDHFRFVPLPRSLHAAVRTQLASVAVIHAHDNADNPNGVPVGYCQASKEPSAPRSLAWYWLFPSETLSRTPPDDDTDETPVLPSGTLCRWHLDAGNIRRQFRIAVQKSGYHRRMTPHDLRRAAATHANLDDGVPLAKIQRILGHNSTDQTMAYIMDGDSQIKGTDSPFDRLMASAG